ncbi:hypothetical protein LEN26_017746 [Aphanomyces euteiches]|nr:hypothetical protein LEN26_017746 [Aphanomyces euteiches]KAH9122886.1 hypothetical protein AeMF1_006004 [Aphanomyces euteiches]KAH9180099.1 hypothetical protein AeNC1_017257 [Aphanomyces euteiches]
MVGLNLFRTSRTSELAPSENQKEPLASSTAFDKKRLDPAHDENLRPSQSTQPQSKRQKTTSSTSTATLMSAFSTGFMKKMVFGRSKSLGERTDEENSEERMSEYLGPRRYPEGTYVATKYGTAIVLQFRDEDDMYVVRMVYNAVAYFHADSIVREIKCMVGDRVKTKWGMATIEHYYVDEDKYSVALDWRWDDDHVWRMKASTKMFDIPTPANATLKSRAQAARSLMSKTFEEGVSSLRMSLPSTSAYTITSLIRLSSAPTPATTPAVVMPLKLSFTPVWSDLFGEGRMESIRKSDQIATIRFSKPHSCLAFMHVSSFRELEVGSGDAIATPFGDGHVVAYHRRGVYEIQLVYGATLYTASPLALIQAAAAAAASSKAKKATLTPSSSSSYFKMSGMSSLPKFNLPSLPQQRKEKYMVGDKLRCPFGVATIIRVQSNDQVFVCALETPATESSSATSSSAPPVLYVHAAQMDSMFPDGVLNTRLSMLVEKTKQAGKEWHSFSYSTASALKAQVKSSLDNAFKRWPRFSVDERVLCPKFGSGFIVAQRPDQVYVVRLRKLKILAYFHEDELRPFPYDKATHVIVGDKHVPVPMEVYQATNKKSRSAIIKESIAAQQHLAAMKKQ